MFNRQYCLRKNKNIYNKTALIPNNNLTTCIELKRGGIYYYFDQLDIKKKFFLRYGYWNVYTLTNFNCIIRRKEEKKKEPFKKQS